jgi:hypothetical protein
MLAQNAAYLRRGIKRPMPRGLAPVAMRKAIAMMLLALASGNAAARWDAVGQTELSTLYADAFRPQQGDLVRMWTLSDLNKPQPFADGKTVSSVVRQEEFNCAEERMRTLYLEFNDNNMGLGDAVYSTGKRTVWAAVSPSPAASGPRSTDRLFFELACRKR